MKFLSSIKDVPDLQRDNVHIRNEEELLEKINKMIEDGHSKLQIVTDFDHTLTRYKMDNGKVVLTSFGKFLFYIFFHNYILSYSSSIALLETGPSLERRCEIYK